MSRTLPKGNFQNGGTVLGMTSKTRLLQNFTTAAVPEADGNWTLWYTDYDDQGFSIGMARGRIGESMQRFPAVLASGVAAPGPLTISNLPDGWMPVQPVYLRLPDGSHRIYFWAHSWEQGVVRYLCADSSDGHNYTVLNPYLPCLYHYNDRAVPSEWFGPAGLTFGKRAMTRPAGEAEAAPEQLSNDATNVYLLPDGSFEMYTVHIFAVDRNDPRYAENDNAAGWIRVIFRRTSRDGIRWDAGQQVIAPDESDQPSTQFYYLAVNHTPQGRVGMLGYYDAAAQTTDIEWCFSGDGIHWERPARRPWLQRSPDLYGIYAPHAMVFDRKQWHLFYTACNYTHNSRQCSGPWHCSEIRLATIDGIV